MLKRCSVLALGVLCACSTTVATQVRPIDPETYTVTGRALTDEGNAEEAAATAASAYCQAREKRMLPDETEESVQAGNGLPETTLYFRCLRPGDPDYPSEEVPASAGSPED